MINKIDNYNTTVILSTNPPVVHYQPEESFGAELDIALSNSHELTCSTDLEGIFETAASTYNIPLNLLKAVAKAESDFDPNCTSSSGAMGIMQLMPATAKELGVTDAYDPKQNIMGGAKYLAENLKIFNGDTKLAVAAYNAGRGAVKKYNGIPPYTETQNYVKKVLSFMNEAISVPDIDVNNDSPVNQTVSSPLATEQKLDHAAKKALRQLSASSDTRIMSRLFMEI